MPDDPSANILMICTGTGSAPFRGFTERRRRNHKDAPGRMMLYFGARRPEELPYFGPLQKVPDGLLRKHFAYSRVPGEPKTYVQDRMRATPDEVATFLKNAKTHIYLCGLKGMETGVDEAFADICRNAGLDWAALRARDARAGPLSRRDVLRFECPVSVQACLAASEPAARRAMSIQICRGDFPPRPVGGSIPPRADVLHATLRTCGLAAWCFGPRKHH